MNILILSSSSRHFPLDIEATLKEAGLEPHRFKSLNEFIASPLRREPFLAILEVGTTEDIDRALVAYEWAETVQPLAAARYLLLMGSKHISLQEKSSRFRGVEIAQLPLPTKNLLFKVELQLKVLNSESKAKTAKKSDGFSAEFREVERERVMVIKGPSPREGGWKNSGETPQGRIRWRWIDDPPKKGRPEERFSWSAESKAAPEFNSRLDAWEVKDGQADLQCHRDGKEIFSAKKAGLGGASPTAGSALRPDAASGSPTSDPTGEGGEPNRSTTISGGANTSPKNDLVTPAETAGGSAGPDKEAGPATTAAPKAPATFSGKHGEGVNPLPPNAHEKKADAQRNQAPAAQEEPKAAAHPKPASETPSIPAHRSIAAGAPTAPAALAANTRKETAGTESEANKEAANHTTPISAALAPEKKSLPPADPQTSLPEKKGLPASPDPNRPPPQPAAGSVATSGLNPAPAAQNAAPTSHGEASSVKKVADATGFTRRAPNNAKDDPASLIPTRQNAPSPQDKEASSAQSQALSANKEGEAGPKPKASKEKSSATHGGERKTNSSAHAEPIRSVQERPAEEADYTDTEFQEKTKEITGKIVVPTSTGHSEPQNLLRASASPDASDRNVISSAARPQEENRHLKTRLFLTLSLEELQDQNSSWIPVEGYRIYLSARHRYYGLRNIDEIFPLWVYEGELAPEFLDLQKSWKFYDRPPTSYSSLPFLPAPVAHYLIEMTGVKIRPAEATAESGVSEESAAAEKTEAAAKYASFTSGKTADLSRGHSAKPALFSGAWFAELIRKLLGP